MDQLSYQKGRLDAIAWIKRCDTVRSVVKVQRAKLNKTKCPKGKHWVQPSNNKKGFCRSGGDGSINLVQRNLTDQQISYMRGGNIDSTDYSSFESDYLNELGNVENYKENGLTRRQVQEGWEESYDDTIHSKIDKLHPNQILLLPKRTQNNYFERKDQEKKLKEYYSTPKGKKDLMRQKIFNAMALLASAGIIGYSGKTFVDLYHKGKSKEEEVKSREKNRIDSIDYYQGRLDAIASLNIRLDDGYIPPEKVRSEAKKGLEARRNASKSNRGGLSVQQANNEGVGSGVQRAVNLVNSDRISLDTIKKMRSFFARHRNNYEKAKSKGLKPEESKAIQAWLLWGGDAGEKWVNEIFLKE